MLVYLITPSDMEDCDEKAIADAGWTVVVIGDEIQWSKSFLGGLTEARKELIATVGKIANLFDLLEAPSDCR